MFSSSRKRGGADAQNTRWICADPYSRYAHIRTCSNVLCTREMENMVLNLDLNLVNLLCPAHNLHVTAVAVLSIFVKNAASYTGLDLVTI